MHKIKIEALDREAARAVHAVLGEVVIPAPAALGLFEAQGRWTIDAYYVAPPDTASLAGQLAAALPFAPPVLIPEVVEDQNWIAVSQSALPPITAGRFTVHGRHDRARVPTGPNSLLIEAGEAFGTGHHATTAGCLLALDRITRRRRFQSVLDLGCGSGVLAIAAARALPAARIDASDSDPVAVAVAAENARINGAGGRLRPRHVCGVPRRGAHGRCRYDLVLANILAGPLISLAPAISRAMTAGGVVILSGILEHEADRVRAAYNAHGFALVDHRRLAGWSTLGFIRRRSTAPSHGRRARRAA